MMFRFRMLLILPPAAVAAAFIVQSPEVRAASETTLSASVKTPPKADGYRGIWYMNQPQDDEYKFKYSGGFATYPQQHIPVAFYSEEANKTFFCYGGTAEGKRELLHMVSYFDHATSTVPRPTILLNKKTDDAHDNPTLMLDDEGHIWIISPSHGTGRPTFLHRSTKPYEIESFEEIPIRNFSYPQCWFVPGKGFLFLHTRYDKGRSLYWMTSRNGREWTEGSPLARMAAGHYQISWRNGDRVGTAFNYHPPKGGLNARTNLYYVETADLGSSWRTAGGAAIEPPLTTTETAALVHEYESEGLLVYVKDLNYDADGHPVILYLTSKGYASGPANDPRAWHTARWTGTDWEILPFTTSDNNYDFGSLYIEPDGAWRIIAPTATGPQPYNTGGEMVMWVSRDQGKSWNRVKQLTRESEKNHTYARRPVNAHEDFYALWADGHGREPSDSSLYFTDRNGDHVWRLPARMTGDTARPEIAW